MELAKETRHYPAYLLELTTGLRRGELLALRWENADLEAKTIQVKENLVKTKEGLIFQSLRQKPVNGLFTSPPCCSITKEAQKSPS